MSSPMGSEPRRRPFLSDIGPLKEQWGWFLGLGIFLILLGILAISASVYTTFVTIFFLGTILIAGGIAKLIYSFWAKEWSGFFLSLLVGLLYLVIGLICLIKPVQAAAALTLLIGSLFVVGGLFKIIGSIVVRFEQWGWVLFSGIVSLILGLLVLSSWPMSSLWIIGLFVGIDMIVYGWLLVLISLEAKRLSM